MGTSEQRIEIWMNRYAAQVLLVDDPTAVKASQAVWQFARTRSSSWSLDKYGAGILLPLAHALVHNWKGKDSITGLSVVARRFGIPSLEYISWLQVHGLDDRYGDVLGVLLGKTYAVAEEVVKRKGWSIWMACTAGYDVLRASFSREHTVTPSEFQVIHPVVSNAKFLTRNIRSERFQYLTVREQIENEANAIVRDFGQFLDF